MKALIKLLPVILLLIFITTGCNNNKTETPVFRKIDQVLQGNNQQNLWLDDKYYWNGECLNKIENYGGDQTVHNRIEFDYVSGSNSKISEFRVFSSPYYKQSANFFSKGLRKIATFGKEEKDNLVLKGKFMPIYHNDKITRLNIYIDEIFNKEFSYVGYMTIEYEGNYPQKMSMFIEASSLQDSTPTPEVEELEILQKHFIWKNGNITTEYEKSAYFLDNGTMDFFTKDSTIYSYDNKRNAYNSIKDIYPMFEAKINSKNNIIHNKKFKFSESGEVLGGYETTIVYQYDVYDFPTIATRGYSFRFTDIIKFEYKDN